MNIANDLAQIRYDIQYDIATCVKMHNLDVG